jgi:Predicted multitransmembrane protein
MKSKLVNSNIIFTIIIFIFAVILFFIPTGFERAGASNGVQCKVEIMKVDNTNVEQAGLIKHGTQVCTVKILSGQFKGMEASAVNELIGKLEMDKIFVPGDKALAGIDIKDGRIQFVTLIDHYRVNLEAILFGAFILLLIVFAGWTGVRAVLSFVYTILMVWKVLIPLFLKGYNPIILALLVVTALTVVTILLVSGFNLKSYVAIAGSLSGSLLTCILAVIFGKSFKVHGAVLQFSESLLYSGFQNLSLTDIFIAGIFIASAGALMDLAMDISAAIYEVVEKKPSITAMEAIKSGFSIGRTVLGTMTTTLLLAYSGGYVALLMVFMSLDTPVINILNLKYVSGEILNTVIGSFGLVMVAPLTAILAGVFFTRRGDTPSRIAERGMSPNKERGHSSLNT